MEKPIAYKNEHGIWIYNQLPQGMRVAIKEDFVDENGDLKMGKKFLAQSFHYPRFEAHDTHSNFFNKWSIWLNNNKIFVQKGSP